MAPIIEALETTIAQQSHGANACEPIWRPLLAGLRLIQR
jgi:hypothetical protein